MRAEYHLTVNLNGNASPMITLGEDFVGGKEYAVAAKIWPSRFDAFPFSFSVVEVVCMITLS